MTCHIGNEALFRSFRFRGLSDGEEIGGRYVQAFGEDHLGGEYGGVREGSR